MVAQLDSDKFYEFMLKTWGVPEATKIVQLVEDALDKFEHSKLPLRQRFIAVKERMDRLIA